MGKALSGELSCPCDRSCYFFIFIYFFFFFIKDVTFAHFGDSCNGDFAVGTNQFNDDGQHPIEGKGISMFDVDDDYKIVYHRANLG